MTLRIQEGSVVPVTCANCGQETFQIALIPGKQKVRCSNETSAAERWTVVEIRRSDGELVLNTWRA